MAVHEHSKYLGRASSGLQCAPPKLTAHLDQTLTNLNVEPTLALSRKLLQAEAVHFLISMLITRRFRESICWEVFVPTILPWLVRSSQVDFLSMIFHAKQTTKQN